MSECWDYLQVYSYWPKPTVTVLSIGNVSSFRELSSFDIWGTSNPVPNIPPTVLSVGFKSDFNIVVYCWLLRDLLSTDQILPWSHTCWLLKQFVSCPLEEAQTNDRFQIADCFDANPRPIFHPQLCPLEWKQTSREVSISDCWEKYYRLTKSSPNIPPANFWESPDPVSCKRFRQMIGVELLIIDKPIHSWFLPPTILPL